MPYQVSYRHFSDYLQQSYPSVHSNPDKLELAWSEYKLSFLRKQYRAFFHQHSRSPWFIEKYDPAPAPTAARNARRAKGREGRVDAFIEALKDGSFEKFTMDATTGLP